MTSQFLCRISWSECSRRDSLFRDLKSLVFQVHRYSEEEDSAVGFNIILALSRSARSSRSSRAAAYKQYSFDELSGRKAKLHTKYRLPSLTRRRISRDATILSHYQMQSAQIYRNFSRCQYIQYLKVEKRRLMLEAFYMNNVSDHMYT